MTTWGFREDIAPRVRLFESLAYQESASDVLRHHDSARQLCATKMGQVRTSQSQQRADAAHLPKKLERTCVETRTNPETQHPLSRFNLILHACQGDWNSCRANVSEKRKSDWRLRRINGKAVTQHGGMHLAHLMQNVPINT